jgi:hypothetical protein
VDRSRLFCAKKEKFSSISENNMASVFWDAEGILFIDYLEKGKTITRDYCSHLLTRQDKKKQLRKTRLPKEKNIFYQNNAPTPKSVLALRKLRDLPYEMLEQSHCSTDLPPPDVCLLP